MVKITKAIAVISDDIGRPIWVRIQYIKKENDRKDEILHDGIFVRAGSNKIRLLEKRMDNYIPPKRFNRMCRQAAAILFDKRPRPS